MVPSPEDGKVVPAVNFDDEKLQFSEAANLVQEALQGDGDIDRQRQGRVDRPPATQIWPEHMLRDIYASVMYNIAKVTSGPYKGLTAIGFGSNQKKRTRATNVALVVAVAKSNEALARRKSMGWLMKSVKIVDCSASVTGSVPGTVKPGAEAAEQKPSKGEAAEAGTGPGHKSEPAKTVEQVCTDRAAHVHRVVAAGDACSNGVVCSAETLLRGVSGDTTAAKYKNLLRMLHPDKLEHSAEQMTACGGAETLQRAWHIVKDSWDHQIHHSVAATTVPLHTEHRDRPCGNPDCYYLVNKDASISLEYCCEKCEGRHQGLDWATGGKNHWKSCDRRET